MSHRPLVFVSALTVGDYLLWNWSLNGNHDVLALVSGLTLPPLAVACLWLLALSGARLIGRYTRQHSSRAEHREPGLAADSAGTPTSTAAPMEAASSSSGSVGGSSGRLAA